MTYEEVVQKVKDAFAGADASKISEHVAIQFNVYGEGEGAFYLEIADGKIAIEPFEYYDRDVIVYTPAAALVEIADGKLDFIDAYTSGRISAQGNLGKAALLQNITVKKPAKAEKAPAKKAEKAEKAPAKKAPAKKTACKTTKKAAPKKDAPKKEEVKKEAPKAEVKKEEPKKEEPKKEEPKKEEPKAAAKEEVKAAEVKAAEVKPAATKTVAKTTK